MPGLERIHAALINGLTSLQAGHLSVSVSGSQVPNVAGLKRVWDDVTLQMPGWEEWPGSAISELKTAQAKFERMATSGGDRQVPDCLDVMLTQAHKALGEALMGTGAALSRVERFAVAEAAALSLPDLGYFITRAEGAHVTAFEASKGHEMLLVVITDGGGIVTDHAGLSDGVCGARQDDFIQSMAGFGVTVEESARTEHRDPRGGAPITAAARHRAATLAAGAVIEGDRAYRRPATGSLFGRSRQHQAIRRTRKEG
jgi:hypothetical protein